jgi:hypothetical protein
VSESTRRTARVQGDAHVLARRLTAYTVIQGLAFVSPFIALPAVARVSGVDGWASIGIGQAVGTMASIVVLFGWWTTGPGELVGLTTEEQRVSLYWRSLTQRGAIAMAVAPVSVAIAGALAEPGWRAESAIVTLAFVLPGLSPGWYFIALAKPTALMTYETGPRVVAAIATVPAVLGTRNVMWYAVLMLVLPAVGYVAAIRRHAPRSLASGNGLRSIRRDLVHQVPVAASNIVGGAYTQLIVPVLGAMGGSAHVGGFVSGDRLYKASRTGIVALGNTMQPWVLASRSGSRQLAAVKVHLLLGTAGFVVILLGLRPATKLLFGPELDAGLAMSVGFGLGFLFTSVSTPLIRNLLVPYGWTKAPLVATSTGCAVCFALLCGLYPVIGVDAAPVAVAMSELAALVVNGLFAWRCLVSITAAGSTESLPREQMALPSSLEAK